MARHDAPQLDTSSSTFGPCRSSKRSRTPEPSIRLRDGMAKTYAWIEEEYMAKYGPGAKKAVSMGKPRKAAKRVPGRKKVGKKAGRKPAASRR